MAKSAKAARAAAYNSVKRDVVVKMIQSNARRGVMTVVRSHTGNSKSAIQNDLIKAYPDHIPVTMNMSQMQAGDILMPKFDKVNDQSVVTGVPHEQFGFHLGKPVILFMDEIFKASKALQVQIADVVNEGRLGTIKLPEGSVIWGASNLETENFGDSTMAYFLNRMAVVEMAKVTGDEWVEGYAIDAGIHPTIIQSAKEYPAMFADYRDYEAGGNQYIFDPRQPQSAFASLRSLERASKMLYGFEEDGLDVGSITHALTGVVGPRAAQDILAVHVLHEHLPTWEDIVKKPGKAKVPQQAGARCLLIYTAIQKLDAKSVKPWLAYLVRAFRKEEQALFATSALKASRIQNLVSTNNEFLKWVTENQYLYR